MLREASDDRLTKYGMHNTFAGMELSELSTILVALGCPAEKSRALAVQLDRRARQLAAQKGRSCEKALAYLLNLMKQGWAAKEKGV